MTTQAITEAIERVATILERKPEAGIQDDSPATACWKGGARVVSSHPSGMQVSSDMPSELGGTGDQVTPGWLFRAALASCSATSIVLAAAAERIVLTALEVSAGSRSDARGLLGMNDARGEPVYAGPSDVTVRVRIAAAGVDPARLRTLVEGALGHSPVPSVVTRATALSVRVDVESG